MPAPSPFLPGFAAHRIETAPGVEIAAWSAGEGPPVLLLHGFPQTHAMWRHVAPALAERHAVTAIDLRGYGASSAPADEPGHAQMSFRAMAADAVAVMAALGHRRFAVVGHDRGARAGHRLALDHPERLTRLALLDIRPTLAMYEGADAAFGFTYWHWFFLPQPRLPELLLGAVDPATWVALDLGAARAADPDGARVLEAYAEPLRDPARLHAVIEDYRAGATIDLEHDRADRAAGRRVACPLLVLWGARNAVWAGADVLGTWRAYADDVGGEGLPCGHFLPEELPAETTAAVERFLAGG